MDTKKKLNDIRYRGFTAKVEPVNNWEQVRAVVEGFSPRLEVFARDVVVLKEEFEKMIDKYLEGLYIDDADVKVAHTFQVGVSEMYLGVLNYIAEHFGISLEEVACNAFDGYIEDSLSIIDKGVDEKKSKPVRRIIMDDLDDE